MAGAWLVGLLCLAISAGAWVVGLLWLAISRGVHGHAWLVGLLWLAISHGVHGCDQFIFNVNPVQSKCGGLFIKSGVMNGKAYFSNSQNYSLFFNGNGWLCDWTVGSNGGYVWKSTATKMPWEVSNWQFWNKSYWAIDASQSAQCYGLTDQEQSVLSLLFAKNWLGAPTCGGPVVCSNLQHVVGLYFWNVEGEIPEELSTLPYLTSLEITASPALRGTIPQSFGNLTALSSLEIGRTGLTGVLPDLSGLKALKTLVTYQTQIVGSAGFPPNVVDCHVASAVSPWTVCSDKRFHGPPCRAAWAGCTSSLTCPEGYVCSNCGGGLLFPSPLPARMCVLATACEADTCNGQGKCDNETFSCTGCPMGYTGPHCTVRPEQLCSADIQNGNPCDNAGDTEASCLDVNGTQPYTCTCAKGYSFLGPAGTGSCASSNGYRATCLDYLAAGGANPTVTPSPPATGETECLPDKVNQACEVCPAGYRLHRVGNLRLCEAVECPVGSEGTDLAAGCSCRAGYTGVITANTSPPSYHNGLCEPFLLSAHVLLPLLLGVVLPVELAATWAIVQLHGKTAVSRAPLFWLMWRWLDWSVSVLFLVTFAYSPFADNRRAWVIVLISCLVLSWLGNVAVVWRFFSEQTRHNTLFQQWQTRVDIHRWALPACLLFGMVHPAEISILATGLFRSGATNHRFSAPLGPIHRLNLLAWGLFPFLIRTLPTLLLAVSFVLERETAALGRMGQLAVGVVACCLVSLALVAADMANTTEAVASDTRRTADKLRRHSRSKIDSVSRLASNSLVQLSALPVSAVSPVSPALGRRASSPPASPGRSPNTSHGRALPLPPSPNKRRLSSPRSSPLGRTASLSSPSARPTHAEQLILPPPPMPPVDGGDDYYHDTNPLPPPDSSPPSPPPTSLPPSAVQFTSPPPTATSLSPSAVALTPLSSPPATAASLFPPTAQLVLPVAPTPRNHAAVSPVTPVGPVVDRYTSQDWNTPESDPYVNISDTSSPGVDTARKSAVPGSYSNPYANLSSSPDFYDLVQAGTDFPDFPSDFAIPHALSSEEMSHFQTSIQMSLGEMEALKLGTGQSKPANELKPGSSKSKSKRLSSLLSFKSGFLTSPRGSSGVLTSPRSSAAGFLTSPRRSSGVLTSPTSPAAHSVPKDVDKVVGTDHRPPPRPEDLEPVPFPSLLPPPGMQGDVVDESDEANVKESSLDLSGSRKIPSSPLSGEKRARLLSLSAQTPSADQVGSLERASGNFLDGNLDEAENNTVHPEQSAGA